MLQAISDRIKGWLGIVIVILIGLPFTLWGISSYLDDAGPQYAAKVNGTEISAKEFERSVSVQRQKMLRQYGGKLPIEEKVVRERTLTQLINQRLLENVTYKKGFRISDPIVAAKIKQQFTVDGFFNRVRFDSYVASLGMNMPMYEQALRNELRVNQMQSAIASSAFVTKKDLHDIAALTEQTRDITVLTFEVDHFSTAKKPTPEEIEKYYNVNRQRFMVPEKVKVDYVEITSEQLAEGVKVDEAQIQKMYDDYVTSISGREERKVRHILIQVSDGKAAARKKIEALKTDLENGADFAELAKKYSQDSISAAEGGDLGWVALGDMVKPFEKTLFAMELTDKTKGVISDVVKTQFGFHLIKLEGVRSETVEPLEAKRAEFEDELKNEEAASMFYDLSERLASLAYENPDSLDVVVEDLGLKVKTSSDFSRSKGDGLFADEKVRSIAFSPLVLEQGSNSDVVELSPTHVVVLRLSQHTPAKAIPLEVVSSKIEDILIAKNGYKQTREAALEIKAKIDAGENAENLKSEGVKVEVITGLGRRDSAKVSDASILYNAFDILPGKDGKPSSKVVDLISGDVALVVLTGVNSPDEIAQEKLDTLKNEVVREIAIEDFSNIMTSIKNNADIDENKRILDK